jgi:hypothetical protein
LGLLKEHTVSIYAWSTLPLGLNNAPTVAGLLVEAKKGEATAQTFEKGLFSTVASGLPVSRIVNPKA